MGPVTNNPFLIAIINMIVVFGVLIVLGVLMHVIEMIELYSCLRHQIDERCWRFRRLRT